MFPNGEQAHTDVTRFISARGFVELVGTVYETRLAAFTTLRRLIIHDSHCRHKAARMHLTGNQIFVIIAHTRYGHICCCTTSWSIQPQCDMRQRCALKPLYGACIAESQRKGSNSSTTLHILGVEMHAMTFPCGRHNMSPRSRQWVYRDQSLLLPRGGVFSTRLLHCCSQSVMQCRRSCCSGG